MCSLSSLPSFLSSNQHFLDAFYVLGYILGGGDIKINKHLLAISEFAVQWESSIYRYLQNTHAQDLSQKLLPSYATTRHLDQATSFCKTVGGAGDGPLILQVLLFWVTREPPPPPPLPPDICTTH